MPVIDTPQGSPEWLSYRKSKIMATDIPIILGSNPWKNKLELWEEKLDLRQPIQLNDAMRRGQLLEPDARAIAIKELGMQFDPCVYESDKYPYLSASLDGMRGCGKYILEIKCPKEFTHLDAVEKNIPLYYLDQMQTQLLVSEAEVCFYFSYRPEYELQKYVIVEVYPDKEKQAEIIEKGYEFYMQMCQMQPPEEWKFNKKG
jgi:putative phage-type endonuclease